MKFTEFSDKLKEIKDDYKKVYKKEMETIKELEQFLIIRQSRTNRRHLKSLKGLGF